MMVLTDSGSTKTAWLLLDRGEVVAEATSKGLNPHHISRNDFLQIIEQAGISDWPVNKVAQVYFYGAGINNEDARATISAWLKDIFEQAVIQADSDLLGAARALLGRQAGIAGILGTGANSGFYDGRAIQQQVLPLGYLLGDEGSGFALGRQFIKGFLRQELPENLHQAFRDWYPGYEKLPAAIYDSPTPAAMLAAFVPFLYEHRADDYIRQLLVGEFDRYFALLEAYPAGLPVALVGSVAWHFREEVEQAARQHDRHIWQIAQSPLPGLQRYHTTG
ncbi:MAG TPA: hypothetical protein ENJ39_08595 [Flammeovirgaceae bacterium]|nr:hypothetical protein [Flammeovirgaceae bacterium]